MKRKIGELRNIPIVEGDKNLVREGTEIHINDLQSKGSSGSSDNAVYYKPIEEFNIGNSFSEILLSFTEVLNINEYSHDFDGGGYVIRYDMPLSNKLKNTKKLYGIVVRPSKVNVSGKEFAFNSFEELFSFPEFS